MDSAVSGLRNHQVRMDIIGNNIANINTVGFKSGRVTFEESLSQLLQGSTRPPGSMGGTNPIQVGMGMSVGSIDMKFTQGNLEATGQVTDLAIEGDSFFAVSSGEGNFYTRNGAFQLDAEGRMVLPTNGFILQGKIADLDGSFPPGTVIENITVPLNEQSPAKATEEVVFGKNLDSDSQALGSVHYSQAFLHHAEAADSLQSLTNSDGQLLSIDIGDVLTYSVQDPTAPSGPPLTQDFIVAQNSTLDDLRQDMENFLQTSVTATINVDILNDGSLTFWNNLLLGTEIQNFQITSDNPLSSGEVTKTFAVPSTIPVGSTSGTYVTDFLRSPAELNDPLEETYDSEGNTLGLEYGDAISFNGAIGGQGASNVADLVYVDAANATAANPQTTITMLLQNIKDNFRLPETDGTIQNNNSVSINAGGTDDNIPDGSIVVRGIAGKSFELGNISVRATDDNNSNPAPVDFNRNLNFTQIQNARDANVYDTSITVFDESGDDHILTMTFVPTQDSGLWKWSLHLAGDEIPLGGAQGEMIFDQDGTVSSFSFDDNATEFSFDPNNGSNIVRTQLDVGGPGDFRGLTQFRSPTTATITAQDGYTTGALREISIGEDGLVSGIFTNGLNKPLAQVMLVDFINPGGLLRISDSVFAESSNSGDPVFVRSGSNQTSSLKPGALEISNVELAAEFTEMITTQRGYQANARGITVSDSLLEELVNLKR
jgi:flagellar hook protein FlgE